MIRKLAAHAFFLLAAGLTVLPAVARAKDPGKTRILRNGFGPVQYLRFSPSGDELVRICQFGLPLLFDTDGYARMRTFKVGMRAVAYSPDGTRMATAEGTDGARIWNAAAPGTRMKRPAGQPADADGPEVRTLGTPLTVLQEPVKGARAKDVPQRVFRAEFSPDGKHLLTTHADGHVKVWSTATWKAEHDLSLTKAEVRAAAFAPDGKTILLGDAQGGLHEWSFEKEAEVWTGRAEGAVMDVVFAPRGGTFATVHMKGLRASACSVRFWDAKRKLVETRSGFRSVAISRDGKLLALGGAHVEILDPPTREVKRVIDLDALSLREASDMFEGKSGAYLDKKIPVTVSALAFRPDGRTLAAGCADGTVRLIDVQPAPR
jgi:hypothetical protein